MASVTGRIQEVKQPRGGYIKPSEFQTIDRNDSKTLSETENLHATIIGLVVDYMTRFMMESNVKKAFEISLIGYANRLKVLGEDIFHSDAKNKCDIFTLLEGIKGLDDTSIISACRAVTYDTWYRNPMAAMQSKSAAETTPDIETIENIRIMVERSISFWNDYGEIVADGFTFSELDQNGNIVHSGYTTTVSSGDGDYLTKDTMWDFKVSKTKPASKHTLQLIMYWIMGQHSGMEIFKGITKIGFFNPRLNVVYLLETDKISANTIRDIEKNVIGY